MINYKSKSKFYNFGFFNIFDKPNKIQFINQRKLIKFNFKYQTINQYIKNKINNGLTN